MQHTATIEKLKRLYPGANFDMVNLVKKKLVTEIEDISKARILDELIKKLASRRNEIEINLKDTRDERLSEIGWVEWFIHRKLEGLNDMGEPENNI